MGSSESNLDDCKTPEGRSSCPGSGTLDDPFIVAFAERDAANPKEWITARKWTYTVASNLSLLCISVSATIYASGVDQIAEEFEVGNEVATLGVSVYQLGFALGSLCWAPLSELFGRRPVFLVSFSAFSIFTLGTALARNITAMLVCRFLAGTAGSSILVTSAAIIGDLFDASDRGLAMSFYLIAAFGGPIVGPLSGSFLAQATTYRWIFWALTIMAGVSFIAGAFVPETYAPIRLKRLAKELSESTGNMHRSATAPVKAVPLRIIIKNSLVRPFQMLLSEGIVAFFAVYSGFIYGLLYGFFGAFPWIYHHERGWSTRIASLPFIAVGIGMLFAVLANLRLNRSYIVKTRANDGPLPPEQRLVLCCAGGVVLPVGLMVFAFTATPSVHWVVPVGAGALFGFGFVGIFLSVTSYLLDTYVLYAASALACTAFVRSLAGAAFPLFIRPQLDGMSTQWSMFLYACLALVAMPVPFLLTRYGGKIREKSRFAAEE